MKFFISILSIGLFSWNSFAQDLEFPTKVKKGGCYISCEQEDGTFSKRELIDCDFLKYTKDAEVTKTLQIKLSNLGYDVNISGKTDLKTIAAYKQYDKDEKKRLGKARRKQQ